MSLTQFQEKILNHYRAHWGEPKETLPLARPFVPRYIGRFEPEPNLFVYSTIGMSEKSQVFKDKSGKNREIKSEIFIYSAVADHEFVDLLALLAEYPFLNDTCFAWGHTVLGGQPVTKNARMTDILLLPPLHEPKSLYSLHLHEKDHIDILWVMPIYRSETIFLRTNPWRNLLNLMIDAEVDAADLCRPSVI